MVLPVGLIASTCLDSTDPVIMYGFEVWLVVVTRRHVEGPLFVWMAEVELIPASMAYPDGEMSRLDPNERQGPHGWWMNDHKPSMGAWG